MGFPSIKLVASLVTLLSLVSLGFSAPRGLVQAGELLDALEKEILTLIEATKQSVVTVTSNFSHEVSVEKESGIFSFFKSEIQKKALSYINIGSGVIYDEAGYILTRSSIVLGADANTITFADGAQTPAQFVGHDPETGLAVLRVEADSLVPARMAKSDDLVVGSWSFMIGNSLGVYPSITFGSVNGLRKDGMIQLSAQVNPGNNGSPIINMDGEVVGLVAGQLKPSGQVSDFFTNEYQTPTLAYPINWVKRIADDIIQYGYVRKGWLGVVGYRDGQPKISEIRQGSPAQKAGLTVGDMITKFASQEVRSISELARLVEYTSPGTTVSLEYVRDNEARTIQIKVGKKTPADSNMTSANSVAARQPALNSSSIHIQPGNANLQLLQQNELLEKRVRALEQELAKLRKAIEAH